MDNQIKFQYPLMDVAKFIMAIFVMGIHSASISDPPNRFLLWVFWSAVPFFFCVNGYFLRICQTKLFDDLYIQKTFRRWLFWLLLYLPYDFYLLITDNVMLSKWPLLLSGLLFEGHTSFSWQLWYVYYLIIAYIIIKRLLNRGLSISCMLFYSLVFVGIANIVECFIIPLAPRFLKTIYFISIYHLVNNLGVAASCILLGLQLRRLEDKALLNAMIAALSTCISSLLFFVFNETLYSRVLLGLAFFLIVIGLKTVKVHPIFIYLRKCSILMFFLHMIPIAFLKLGGVRLEFTEMWIFVTLTSLIMTLIVIWLKRQLFNYTNL